MDSLSLLTDLLAAAKTLGAEGVDAVCVTDINHSVSCRLGKVETVERAENNGIGLRVMVGKRQAIVSSSDFTLAALKELAARAVDMARIAPEDPYVQLAAPDMLATALPDLELNAGQEPTTAWLTEQAQRAEAAALAVPGITNSQGADAGHSQYRIALATSQGFAQSYAATMYSLSATVLAGEGTQMERDYDYSTARFATDLLMPEAIGKQAGERTVRKLHPRKLATCAVPVLFEPRVGRELLGALLSGMNGAMIARGTSFLKDACGQAIFPAGITVVDDPLRRRGLASKPFDGEGIATRRQTLVEEGVLQQWLLDLRSAAQLGLITTGHAARGLTSAPSPAYTNAYIAAGTVTPKQLLKEVKQGLYVTDTFGMGINTLTGDYSQGAAGFWIENGELAYPVSEITIAGNLREMFKQLTAANDLEFRYSTNVPTLRVERMTVAGS